MEKNIEIWKDINGYKGWYQVSNLGTVFCRESYVVSRGKKYRKKPHILKDACNGLGYRYVTISVNNVRKNHYVHKLVVNAFLRKNKNKPEVNHKNGIKSDNRLSNLERISKLGNMRHAIITGLHKYGEFSPNAIKVYDLITGKEYGYIKGAAKDKGINYGTLKDALSRNTIYKGLTTQRSLVR